MKIILQISLLYIIYLFGVWIQETLQLIIPGSMIGMLLMFGLLMTKRVKGKWIAEGSQLLIKHLPLLFLPVTVGIITLFDVFKGKGFFILIIVVFSTILVMISTAIISQGFNLRKAPNHE